MSFHRWYSCPSRRLVRAGYKPNASDMLALIRERKVKMKVKRIAAFILALTLIVGVLALPASATTYKTKSVRCPSCNTINYTTPTTWSTYGHTQCTHGHTGETDALGKATVSVECDGCGRNFIATVYGTYCWIDKTWY
jgi:hypothetical protein